MNKIEGNQTVMIMIMKRLSISSSRLAQLLSVNSLRKYAIWYPDAEFLRQFKVIYSKETIL